MLWNLSGAAIATRIALLIALSLAFGPFAVRGEEKTGRIPYKAVAELFDGFAKLKAKDKLEFEVRIVPGPKAKPIAPIQVELDSKWGRQKLSLAENGALVDFPLTDALRKENPWILGNQPKGTLDLVAELRIKYPGELTAPADYYRQGLDQMNGAIRSQAGLLSVVVPTAKTVVFQFATGTNAVVKLRGDGPERDYVSDTNGLVRLNLGRSSGKAVETIVLPAVPKRISISTE